MTRMPHLPAESWDAFVRDEMSEEAAGRIDAHLDACAECRDALGRADASFLYRQLRDEPPPPAAFDGMWEAIEAELQAPRESQGPRRWLLAGGVAAAAALVAVLALQVGRSGGDGDVIAASGPTARTSGSTSPLATPAVAPADPCPAVVAASLKLTREECAALFSGPISSDEPPQVMVSTSVDLRGL